MKHFKEGERSKGEKEAKKVTEEKPLKDIERMGGKD